MSATARPYIGVLPAPSQCRIPEGSEALEMKYCEMCGLPFTRKPEPKVAIQRTEHVLVHAESTQRKARWVPGTVTSFVYKDTGERFCRRCKPRPFVDGERVLELSEAQERYKIQLPDIEKIHRSSHPVRYDDSLVPKGRETSSHKLDKAPQLQKRVRTSRHPEWKDILIAAFAKTPRMSLEQICDVLPGCFTLPQAYMYVYFSPYFKLKPVGKEFPEDGGRSHKIFELVIGDFR